jgi:erythromycin esterase
MSGATQTTEWRARSIGINAGLTVALLAACVEACAISTPEGRAGPSGGRPSHGDAVGGADNRRTDAESLAAIEGYVVGPAGEPIAGALVSASGRFHPQIPDAGHEVFSDEQGRFQFGDMRPGRYGMTATSRAGAAYAGIVIVSSANTSPRHVVLRLGDVGTTFQGVVLDEVGAPLARARVLAAAYSENEAETYVVHADSQGRYLINLPGGQRYMLSADAAPRPRASQQVEPVSRVVDFRLDPLPAPRPTDKAIRQWLHEQATSLSDASELNPVDAAAFNAIVGDAPFVAMGEATHGSAEFVEWRRRVFQMLVRDRGFTVYAAEVPWAEALAIDDYVLHGRGDALEAIRAARTWETEELLKLVRWMRAYNAEPNHQNKLHFAGFDVLAPQAVVLLLDYLRRVDRQIVPSTERILALLASVESESAYTALLPADQERLRGALGALVARMDENHGTYAARTGEAAWARARHCARVIEQAAHSCGDYAARDQYMFENIGWLIEHHPAGTKFLLSAHNNHIGAEQHDVQYMGRLMRQQWGTRYVSIGFSFGEGALRALDWTGGDPNSRRNFHVAPAPAGTFDHDLSLADDPRLVIDLRRAQGPIKAWLHSAQLMRSIGGGFSGPDDFEVYTPARAFDAIIYLDRITAVHPLDGRP